MVLFPIVFLWFLGVMIWVIRNNVTEPGPDGQRRWTRPRPRLPRRPGRDGRGGSAARADASRRERRRERREHRVPRP